MSAVFRHDAEKVAKRGEDIDTRREGVTFACFEARPLHHQWDVPERFVDGHGRLAPDVALAEVVAVVRAEDDGRVVHQAVAFERFHDLAEPVVDHRQLAAVLGTHLERLALRHHAFAIAAAWTAAR